MQVYSISYMAYNYMLKPKGTIKRKLTLIISSATAIGMIIGVMLVYLFGVNLLKNTIGKERAQIAQSLGAYVAKALTDEIEDARSYTVRPLWIDAVKEANLKYAPMSKDDMARLFADMDKIWLSKKEESPLFKEYLENRVSISMKDIIKVRGNVAEIFITDRFGGLVAASGKTSDFYQADEEWWQRAYNNGKGDIYVGNVEFDQSSGLRAIPIAVPIKDADGRVIGVCQNIIAIQRLFDHLAAFRIGESGHAVLIDDKCNVLFHHEAPSVITKLCGVGEFDRILRTEKKYLVLKDPEFHGKDVFIAFSSIKPPYMSDKAITWIVFIAQDVFETFSPLYSFIGWLIIIAIFMIILAIPIGLFFGSLIANPIHKLHVATEHVMAGDWDYKIVANTGDEIEQFADTFRDMVADIKIKQAQLQSFSKSLEAKVEDRTRELTETKEALEKTNKELLKLDQLKSDFISTVSHELRTPLSIIKEGINLVLDKIPGKINEKQEKILDISRYNIDRLARIIDSLLDISKIEAGKVELKRGLVNIADIVRHTADSFETMIKDKGLALRLDIDRNTGNVYADADRITQVFTNLIGNSVKFTPSGHIEISCKDIGDSIECSVADTGAGISKEDMPKVFDKFQQFGRMAGAGDKGTGLGLSIAKGIIDMHSGQIWVESEPGRGSKFTFKLPKYTAESLFKEFVSNAVDRAARDESRMSIIILSSKASEDSNDEASLKKNHAAMMEGARLIKNSLHKEDDVVTNDGDVMAILADCDKERLIGAQYRIEEMLNRYLKDQKLTDKIKIQYGRATYPDDASNAQELIEKANAL
ncbi:MAG: diguanylate cyclase [Candidatus Omnitrophica bacterium]|nr:diguanylate cyclase [Candidatus Omnitrophota bacterium]